MSELNIRFALDPNKTNLALQEEEARLADDLQQILFSTRSTKTPMDVIERLVTFRNWVIDAREPYLNGGKDDKFAGLVDVARRFPACESYFSERLKINNTTVWRWATGRNRPSKLIGETIAQEIRSILISSVSNDYDMLEQDGGQVSACGG